jgi:hypothetical protein
MKSTASKHATLNKNKLKQDYVAFRPIQVQPAAAL